MDTLAYRRYDTDGMNVNAVAPARWPARTATRERNRADLLQATLEIATERGYHGTTLDAVARRAGLTKGAVYSIFGSKQRLFIEALQTTARMPRLADTGDPGAPMADVLRRYGTLFRQRMESLRKLFAMSVETTIAVVADEQHADEYRAIYDEVIDAFAAELEAYAAAAGETLPMAARDVAQLYIAALQGLSQQAMVLHVDDMLYETIGPAIVAPGR